MRTSRAISDTVLADIFQWFAQFVSDARIWMMQTLQCPVLSQPCILRRPPNAVTIYSSRPMARLVHVLPGGADFVVNDYGPAGAGPEAALIARLADATGAGIAPSGAAQPTDRQSRTHPGKRLCGAHRDCCYQVTAIAEVLTNPSGTHRRRARIDALRGSPIPPVIDRAACRRRQRPCSCWSGS
ncbi:MAG: hypothetical protein RL274_921 [Pseudomonadota bacterium]